MNGTIVRFIYHSHWTQGMMTIDTRNFHMCNLTNRHSTHLGSFCHEVHCCILFLAQMTKYIIFLNVKNYIAVFYFLAQMTKYIIFLNVKNCIAVFFFWHKWQSTLFFKCQKFPKKILFSKRHFVPRKPKNLLKYSETLCFSKWKLQN